MSRPKAPPRTTRCGPVVQEPGTTRQARRDAQPASVTANATPAKRNPWGRPGTWRASTLKRGVNPKTAPYTAYAATEASTQGISTSNSNSKRRYKTSVTRTAAASGAWRTAPSPAAAPASVRVRVSTASSRVARRSTRAPSCPTTVKGASRPTSSPTP